jgi:ABC-type glutathione transport system ATPase component
LIEPTSGSIQFDGRDLLSANSGELRRLRRHMQIIFQDPFSSLDPRMRVEDLIAEPLLIHGNAAVQESAGEDMRIESYEETTLPFPRDPIGQTPIAARQRLTVPTNVSPRWKGSDVKWYVTLKVKVYGGTTIRRRYRFDMWA